MAAIIRVNDINKTDVRARCFYVCFKLCDYIFCQHYQMFPPFRRPLNTDNVIKGGIWSAASALAFVFGEFGSVGYYVSFESLR